MMGAKRNAMAQNELRRVLAKGSLKRRLVLYESMIEMAHAMVSDLINVLLLPIHKLPIHKLPKTACHFVLVMYALRCNTAKRTSYTEKHQFFVFSRRRAGEPWKANFVGLNTASTGQEIFFSAMKQWFFGRKMIFYPATLLLPTPEHSNFFTVQHWNVPKLAFSVSPILALVKNSAVVGDGRRWSDGLRSRLHRRWRPGSWKNAS